MTLSLRRDQVLKGAAWLTSNFASPIAEAIRGTPVSIALVQAIACKETHNLWLSRTATHRPEELLANCIGDACGDVPECSRTAFPRNGGVFRAEYGDAFADALIAEANKMRAMRGMPPSKLLYKGYGIFQYDLQHVKADEDFFRKFQWHDMNHCLHRLMRELKKKFASAGGNTREAVRRYNGSGARAEAYADEVMQFCSWCEGTT
ncbi:hypothetical protein [Roseomonas sp. BN140053]|uniref:hypothetical protein n=1 Tax=Roseomonas sp. BN140053 TaxID=3391898 RepID=UPI0039E98BEF